MNPTPLISSLFIATAATAAMAESSNGLQLNGCTMNGLQLNGLPSIAITVNDIAANQRVRQATDLTLVALSQLASNRLEK